jgi:hypothetical protein
MQHLHRSTHATIGAIAASLLAIGGFGITACNSLTGANDVLINPNMGEDDGEANSDGSTGGPTSGSGGTTSSTGTGSTGAGSSGTGSTGSGSTGSGMGGDPGPTDCEYPGGPYGVAEGDTVPPTLSWEGYAPGASSPSTIAVTDFFDCDGTRGIHALYFDTSQFG